MDSTEFVYLIVQDAKRGTVITIHDNRDRLEAEAEMSGLTSEGEEKINL